MKTLINLAFHYFQLGGAQIDVFEAARLSHLADKHLNNFKGSPVLKAVQRADNFGNTKAAAQKMGVSRQKIYRAKNIYKHL
ncbi:MAG: helix-turn-helix domain-containing protein [Bdellovibrionaceae bacterium]|nr:helix-turn-helix domain-containing protein [Pseudobdellovibrionaceae bacterium]